MDEYFCPNCQAILNDQWGFDSNDGTWTCTQCGQLLMDDDVYDGDNYEGVAWYCDKCGALLNRQYGFSDNYDFWTCTECRHTNGITEDDIIEGTRFGCPNCYATLNNQLCFNQCLDDWECTECGTHLHHDSSDEPYPRTIKGASTAEFIRTKREYDKLRAEVKEIDRIADEIEKAMYEAHLDEFVNTFFEKKFGKVNDGDSMICLAICRVLLYNYSMLWILQYFL